LWWPEGACRVVTVFGSSVCAYDGCVITDCYEIFCARVFPLPFSSSPSVCVWFGYSSASSKLSVFWLVSTKLRLLRSLWGWKTRGHTTRPHIDTETEDVCMEPPCASRQDSLSSSSATQGVRSAIVCFYFFLKPSVFRVVRTKAQTASGRWSNTQRHDTRRAICPSVCDPFCIIARGIRWMDGWVDGWCVGDGVSPSASGSLSCIPL